jgi:Flp pilus assembly protein TadB
MRLLVVGLLSVMLSGCVLFSASTKTDAGHIKATHTKKLDATGTMVEENRTVDVTGATGKTTQPGGAQAIKSSSPSVEMDGKIKVSVGTLGVESEGGGIESTLANPTVMLSILGGLIVLGAVAYGLIMGDWRGIVIPVAIGLGICAVALVFMKYPLVILGLFLLGAAGVGYYFWQRNKSVKVTEEKEQVDETLQVVARAIEGASPESSLAIKNEISKLAGKFKDEVKAVISAVKEKAGI